MSLMNQSAQGVFWRAASVALLCGASSACDAAPTATSVRRGPLPTGTLPEGFDAGVGCHFPDGRLCPARSTCPASDDCNACFCEVSAAGAPSLRCTLIGCPPHPRSGTVVTSWQCQFESGRWCTGACIADDGCNACRCHADGTLTCTDATCEAAAPGTCRDDSDCPTGQECRATSPGCGLRPRCAPRVERGDFAWFCLCDGTSAIEYVRPGRPYASEGPCPGYRSHIGNACSTNADCGGNMFCDLGAQPHCVQTCLSTNALQCPPDARCITTSALGASYCLRACESDADCVGTPGLRCHTFSSGRFEGRGCAP